MEHIPTTESYVKKVVRIAKELGISIDKASITCDAFELVFSDPESRQAIFGMIEQLDESAARRGEPSGLIINYGVEVGLEGIRVSRYADEIPAGEIVNLTPADQAMIFLKIEDDFPTQEFLGPMIVNRPAPLAEEQFSVGRNGSTDRESNELPSPLAKEGWQPVSADGVVCSEAEAKESEIPTDLPSHWADVPICLGPIRLKFHERFPFVSAGSSQSQLKLFVGSSDRTALDPSHLPPWPALLPALPWASGLSPPIPAENLGHS